MKGQTFSRYVKVKGQIIITGKKKSSTGLLHRAKLIHAFAAENVFVRRA